MLYIILIFATIPYVPKIWGLVTKPLGKNTSSILNISYGLLGLGVTLFSYFKLQKKSLTFYAILGLLFLSYTYLLKNLNVTVEKVHLLEYGLLSFLVYWAVNSDMKWILTYGIILATVFIVGWADESIQMITPGRVYEFSDVLLNWKAGVLGFLFVLTFKRFG